VLRFYTKGFINACSKVPFTFASQVPVGFCSVKQMVQENIDLILTISGFHVWLGPSLYPDSLDKIVFVDHVTNGSVLYLQFSTVIWISFPSDLELNFL